MKVLCYGDSNTYGYDPRGFFGGRYPKESRWVDILVQRTGWEIRNEGQNGREIPSRPFQYQRAGELLTQSAPDVFAIMLGTNDLLRGYSAVETSSRMEAFLRYLQPKCGRLLLIAKAERKGRSRNEVLAVTAWLTGYTDGQLEELLNSEITYGDFFRNAPALNPARRQIKGSVCGVKLETIEDPLMREIRYLDKLVDELAKGKPMARIMR